MKLSEREWTVLSALWETEGAELGVLVTKLYENTGWSRNTVLTYLTRMEARGFLFQTLTVSGVAVPLLVIKALFKDKLPPRRFFSLSP